MTSFSLTENGALSYESTCSSLMDLFIKSVRGCDKRYIMNVMIKAWNENPELLLKMVCLTRDPRNGKGERDVTYHMIEFLKIHFPKTYKLNAKQIALEYGRLEDLLEFAQFPLNDDTTGNFEMQVFAEILRDDLTKKHPSLAVKWAPREGNSYSNFARILSQILFPQDKKSLARYRKEILNPLSKKITTVEQLMCANMWNKIEYSTVPSQAMKIYGRTQCVAWNKKEDAEKVLKDGAFICHDKERFETYRSSVAKGEAKINTTGLQPHQLVAEISKKNDETIELQWNAMIDKLRGIPELSKSMAVVDVSGSMSGQPMEVAIALGLIIAELAHEPFKHKMITFSENPTLRQISGKTLHDKVNNMRRADWGASTNIEAVFDLLLNSAITFNIPPDNMVKTLFIFTDMQFNQAYDGNQTTLFDTIRKKYADKNYPVPKLVFWNLRASSHNAFPVTMDEIGTAYLSGFSAELLKVFMQGIEFNPSAILTELLSRYKVQIDAEENKFKFDLNLLEDYDDLSL